VKVYAVYYRCGSGLLGYGTVFHFVREYDRFGGTSCRVGGTEQKSNETFSPAAPDVCCCSSNHRCLGIRLRFKVRSADVPK
jgi:hypothetical protein